MLNEIKIFENLEFGSIRTVIQDGEPWFVGKDVAEALGYKNSKDALKTHVADEDRRIIQRSEITTFENHIPNEVFPVNSVSTDIPNRGLTIINESGIYALIFGSKLESAKRFKHWVTSEVLPSIRKTGKYTSTKLTDEHVKALDYITKSTKEQLPFISSILQDAGFNMGTSKNAESYEDKFIKSLDVVGRITDDVYEEYTARFGADSLSKTLFSRKVNLLHGTSTKTKKVGTVTKRTYELNFERG